MNRWFWPTVKLVCQSIYKPKIPKLPKFQLFQGLGLTLLQRWGAEGGRTLGQEILKENHPFLVPSCFRGYEKPLLSLCPSPFTPIGGLADRGRIWVVDQKNGVESEREGRDSDRDVSILEQVWKRKQKGEATKWDYFFQRRKVLFPLFSIWQGSHVWDTCSYFFTPLDWHVNRQNLLDE